jgi:hypothetical protein
MFFNEKNPVLGADVDVKTSMTCLSTPWFNCVTKSIWTVIELHQGNRLRNWRSEHRSAVLLGWKDRKAM